MPTSTPLSNAAAYLVELAGLFHDVGKANQAFQDKLKSTAKKPKKQGDPLRHEYVSWWMLEQLVNRPTSDTAWLDKLRDAEKLTQHLNDVFSSNHYMNEALQQKFGKKLDKTTKPKSLGDLFAGIMTQEALQAQTPLLFALAWLVISHHRLPALDDEMLDEVILDMSQHVNLCNDSDKLEDCLRSASGKQAIWQENTEWATQVAMQATALHDLLQTHPNLFADSNIWIPFIAHYCRTMLMLGDHFVSNQNTQQCFTGDKKAAKPLYFANTNRAKGCMAATLNEHLRGVGKESGSLFRLGLRLLDNLPGITPEALPDGLRQIHKQTDSPFYWQDDACQKIKDRVKDSIQDSGFFGIVLARTGAGKTRACARLMAQLSPRVRYNLALGLRTLTLQSGTAYREELGLDDKQVSTLVGSELARRLHEINLEASGSESATSDNLDDHAIDGMEDVDLDLPPQLQTLLATEPKKRLLLTAPILVSTVDYLVAAANPNRSRHLYASLRLMTSDLVLDEVDAYSEEDLIVLGKLVYLCGLFGRKVLLASATIPPALAEQFFAAYATGYTQYCARKQQEPRLLFAGWFADQASLSRVEKCSSTEVFKRIHGKITQQLVGQLQGEIAKRQAVLLELPTTQHNTIYIHSHKTVDLSPVFAAVLAQCHTFHQQHAITDPQTGKRVSIGLVRWSNTEPCWRFAEYLLRHEPTPDQPDHRVLCYHSKLLPVVRFEVEKQLDVMLKRKDEAQFLQHPLVRQALDHSTAQDILLVVSATPIEEIGRDHDFDWAIIEPSSTRAIIQTAGRVRRHRPTTADTQNIALLSTTIRGYKGKDKAFCFPGVESDGYALKQHRTQSVYDFDLLTQNIDARSLLNQEQAQTAAITTLEHRKLSDWLNGKAKRKDSHVGLQHFIQSPAMALSDHHAKHNRFRRAHSNLLFWLDEENQWYCREEIKHKFETVEIKSPATETIPMNRYICQWDVEELYADLKTKLFADKEETLIRQQLMSIESACYSETDKNHTLRYHPLLGVYRLR
jgi:CRISPR-associated endonuclease/helicase Cas3